MDRRIPFLRRISLARRGAMALLTAVIITAVITAGGMAGVGWADDEPVAEQPPPTVIVVQSDVLGPYLATAAGMTLYRFTRDQPDVSVCLGGCAATWPPLLVDGPPAGSDDLPGVLGTITRPDGTLQVTYNHLPLYTYAGDAQPGDARGQALGNVWFVVSPTDGMDTAAAQMASGAPEVAAPPAAAPAATPPSAPPSYQDRKGYDYGY